MTFLVMCYVCLGSEIPGLSGQGPGCGGLRVRQTWVLALPLTVDAVLGKSLTSVGPQCLVLPALLVGVVTLTCRIMPETVLQSLAHTGDRDS